MKTPQPHLQADQTHSAAPSTSPPRQVQQTSPTSTTIAHSPRMTAQRKAISAAFGPHAAQAQLQADTDQQLLDEAPAPALATQRAAAGKDVPFLIGMSNQLKSGIDAPSVMNMVGVRLHRQPEKLAQLAGGGGKKQEVIRITPTRTLGGHLRPRQEQHLRNEAWCVMQQKHGRAESAPQMASIGVIDAAGLESKMEESGADTKEGVARAGNKEATLKPVVQMTAVAQRKEVATLDEVRKEFNLFSYQTRPVDADSIPGYIDKFKAWLIQKNDTLSPAMELELTTKLIIKNSATALADLFRISDTSPPSDADAGNPKLYVGANYMLDFLFSDFRMLTTEAIAALDSIKIITSIESVGKFGWWQLMQGDGTKIPLTALKLYKQEMQVTKEILSKEGQTAIENYIQSELGGNIIGAMNKANIRNIDATDDPFQYPGVEYKDQGQLSGGSGHLNPEFWKKIQYSSFILRPGKNPSEAIAAAFNGPTRLECLSTTRAVLAKALADTLPKQEFDTFFAYVSDADPGLVIGTNTAPRDRVRDLMNTPHATSPAHLMKGDWIYYKNDPRYLQKHPQGLWQGENCIYAGNNKFSGFGLSGMTLQELKTSMERAFNEDPSAADINSDPQLSLGHLNRKPIAIAKDANAPGLDYSSLRRFHLSRFLL